MLSSLPQTLPVLELLNRTCFASFDFSGVSWCGCIGVSKTSLAVEMTKHVQVFVRGGGPAASTIAVYYRNRFGDVVYSIAYSEH